MFTILKLKSVLEKNGYIAIKLGHFPSAKLKPTLQTLNVNIISQTSEFILA